MQSSYTSQNNISTILICILITFIICHFPEIVNGIARRLPSVDYSCGAFMRYLYSLQGVGYLLNSSINGLIYFGLNNHFRSALLSHCYFGRNDRRTVIEMGRLTEPRPLL